MNISEETYVEVKGQIRKDLIDFIEKIKNDYIDMPSIDIKGIEYYEVINVIEKVFRI